MSVWVVTRPDLGWDCVVGVYSRDNVGKKDLEEFFGDDYIIQEHDVDVEIDFE